MSNECIEKLENEKPRKKILSSELARRSNMLLRAMTYPHDDPTEQYKILKGILLCGKLREK